MPREPGQDQPSGMDPDEDDGGEAGGMTPHDEDGEPSAEDLNDAADADDADEDADDEDDGQPWPIANRPPSSMAAWLAELLAGYRHSGTPPALETDDGRSFHLGEGGLLEAGVALCLHNRGARIPVEAVYGLVGVITDMVNDLKSMGPEWTRLQQVPPLAFCVYYVWSHIVIGHLSEDLAMEIVRGATDHLDEFTTASDAD